MTTCRSWRVLPLMLLGLDLRTAEPILYTARRYERKDRGYRVPHALSESRCAAIPATVQPFVFLNVWTKGQGACALRPRARDLPSALSTTSAPSTVILRSATIHRGDLRSLGDDLLSASTYRTAGSGSALLPWEARIPPYPLSFKNGNICAVCGTSTTTDRLSARG